MAQVILRIVEFGTPVEEAINAYRFHHQLYPSTTPPTCLLWHSDILTVEKGTEQSVIDELKSMGHEVVVGIAGANVQAVLVHPNGDLDGASDKRKHGKVAEYKRYVN